MTDKILPAIPFPLTLTPAAAARVRSLIEEEEEDATFFLRVAIKGGGCAGFTYAFTLEDELQSDDLEQETQGVRVVIDQFSVPLVMGAVLDYSDTATGGQMIVRNPSVRTTCGCGASFDV